jgi:hypothetical protein
MVMWSKEITSAIDSVVDNPQIVDLYRRWENARNMTGAVPDIGEFSVTGPLAGIAGDLMILQVEGDELIYRYYGADIARHAGFDMTGRSVASFGGAIGNFFIDCYRRVLAATQPMYTVHVAERLILPLQDDKGVGWLAGGIQPAAGNAQRPARSHPRRNQ